MNMKLIGRIVVFIVIATGNASGTITHEQAGKLAGAIWKSPPLSMDVTYCVAFEDNTKSEQDLREMYEKEYDQMHGPKESLSPYLLQDRESTIRKNVERFIKEQQEGGRKVTYRIRFDGNYLRIDRADGVCSQMTPVSDNGQDKSLDSIPFGFSSIEIDDQNGSIERFEYLHQGKRVTKRTINNKSKQDIAEAPIRKFALIPSSLILKMKLGTSTSGLPKGPYEVNATKMDQLCSGKLDGIKINVSPDENSPDIKENIEVLFYAKDSNKQPIKTFMVCDKKDYSKVYFDGYLNPATNQIMPTRLCSNFDSQGYPHSVTKMEYDHNGKLKNRETYQILDIHLNIPISKDVFAFNPPPNYEIVDFNSNGQDKVVREKGGFEGGIQKFSKAAKEKDVEALKGLLGHEDSKIRRMSLQSLGFLLAQKPDELKATVLPLKNDPNQRVRDEAQKILTRLESTEPNKK
jgi:hypothetical protein